MLAWYISRVDGLTTNNNTEFHGWVDLHGSPAGNLLIARTTRWGRSWEADPDVFSLLSGQNCQENKTKVGGAPIDPEQLSESGGSYRTIIKSFCSSF